ncbi:hypothetical protein JM946_28005 [Steroidobacter sp. S1-65]|uniref:Uncharacterized protein n=1 Tax=Steroidobacter gossypii TaxID=2805490 RepID=A0ABS1X5U0_9GAMM|nr:hypothetical protein [Steroidobacter gossypii]MBM0108594.1 hypothetical protein [Steroidobacter gossypii]
MTDRVNIDNCPSREQLLTMLAKTRLDVPGRTEGRSTEHTERWVICRLLATVAALDRLRFPLSVSHGDKPDFSIIWPGLSIGIEVTEAISTDYARCLALAELERPGAIIDMSLFRWGSKSKSLEELRGIIKATRLQGDGWVGDSAEIEWSRYIESIIAAKRQKLSGYLARDRQWLAIYDNLPLPHVHLAGAAEKLQSLLEPWAEKVGFDALFIERGPVILEMTAHSICFHHLNDLW